MGFKEEYGSELAETLTALDADLRVVAADGKVLCCLAFVATFYVRRVDRPDVRERLVRAFELYRSGIGDRLLWGADPKTTIPKRLAGTKIADVRSWMSKVGPSGDFSFVFHGGERKEDADPYRAVAYADPGPPEELSFVTFGWPVSWVTERSIAALVALVGELAAILGPTHGYAGWGIVTHVTGSGSEPAMSEVSAFAQRFRGLEVDEPVSHSLVLKEMDAIKGINWLTVLDPSWVEKVGGLEALKAELGEGIVIHSYDEGIAIQAGPRPLLGDVHSGERMPHYHRVSQALKPIRTRQIDAFSIDFYGFGEEQTAKWLARFDVE